VRAALLFSATFKAQIEALCHMILTDPLRITVGPAGEACHPVSWRFVRFSDDGRTQANADVHQEFVIVQDPLQKFPWLLNALKMFAEQGSVLIFVGQRTAAEELATNLKAHSFHGVPGSRPHGGVVGVLLTAGGAVAALHGEMAPSERSLVMHAFRSGTLPVLVATDIAGTTALALIRCEGGWF
jgi:superfamily II DNA/RNA helicase